MAQSDRVSRFAQCCRRNSIDVDLAETETEIGTYKRKILWINTLIVYGAPVSKGRTDFDANTEGDYLCKQTDESGEYIIFSLILPSVLSDLFADIKDEVILSVGNVINDLLSVVTLSRDQKKTISTTRSALSPSTRALAIHPRSRHPPALSPSTRALAIHPHALSLK